MPIRDHYRPPDEARLPWESLHTAWIGELAGRLNAILPQEYLALDARHVGRLIEVDIGAFESGVIGPYPGPNGVGGGAAVAPAVYAPPVAAGDFPVEFPDVTELKVFADRYGRTLVGAVELVSPGNKDRGGAREGFVAKCVAYLAAGVSLVVVDVVTDRHAVLHNDIIRELGGPTALELPDEPTLYAASYRPLKRGDRGAIQVWPAAFRVGDSLPTMPLRLVGDLFVPVELELTYTEACRRRRLI
ncbi:MAG: DUF4058 domain-containing protein [Gemmataceae bacterium]|nr:DUF4058 domain-containing protein [Gemmataceae bacterium]